MTIQTYDKALNEAEQRIADLEKQIQYVNQLLTQERRYEDSREEMQELLATVQERTAAR